MNLAVNPMALGGIGPPEILLILLVLVLLFGAKKLPELARGSGRALRIFKAETKGLIDDEADDDKYKTPEQKQIEALGRGETHTSDTAVPQSRPDSAVPQSRPDAER